MAGVFKALKSAVTGSEAAPFELLAKHQHFEERSYPAMKWVCTKRKGRSRAEVQKDMFMTLFAYINGKNESSAKIDMTVPVTVSWVQCEEEETPKQNGESETTAAKDEDKPTENGTAKDENEEKPKENGSEEEEKKEGEAEEKKEKKEGEEKKEENGEGKTKEKEKEKKEKKSKSKAAAVVTGTLKEYTMGFFIPKTLQEDPPKPSDPDVFIEDRPAMTIVTRTFGGYVKETQWDNEKKSLAEEIEKTPGDLTVDTNSFFTAGYDPPFKPLFRRNEVWLLKTGGAVAVPPPEEEKKKEEEEKKEKETEKKAKTEAKEEEKKEEKKEEAAEAKEEKKEGEEEANKE